jgi:hypothetical protein
MRVKPYFLAQRGSTVSWILTLHQEKSLRACGLPDITLPEII